MNHSKPRLNRIIVIVCAIFALTSLTVLAYLSTTTGALNNLFNPAVGPNAGMEEDVDNPLTVKKDVLVNVGKPGYAVYVRAVIVVNWEKDGSNGTYHATKPVLNTDYTLEINEGAWFKQDEFYYHKAMVAYDGSNEDTTKTSVLIENCVQAVGANVPEGYHLNVEIVAQTIQALGTTDVGDIPAVTNAWGVTVKADGTLSDGTP